MAMSTGDNPYAASSEAGSGERPTSPTSARHGVIFAAFLMAFLLYLDRNSYSFAEKSMKKELDNLTLQQISGAFSAFFLAYALGQVPSGWLADRFGPRRSLLAYILVWSLFTGLLGFVYGGVSLIVFRAGMGLAQAGAYPTSSGIVARWMPISSRGAASSIVALGGRLGGAFAPFLTARFIAHSGWRPAMIVYGLSGILVGAIYWFLVRDNPSEHPRCNEAERELIARGKPATAAPRAAIPWRAFLTNFNLWMYSLYQFATNIGWIFLMSWLPRYLEEVHQAPILTGRLFVRSETGLVVDRGLLASLPLLVGILGMVFGGWLTDRMTLAFGVRWGRVIPIAMTRFLAATAYVICLFATGPLFAIFALCLVAIATDMGVPATWAYSQDVGGKNVGSILGWGNMWGNFGAAIGPPLLIWCVNLDRSLAEVGGQSASAAAPNWNYCFIACAVAFAVSGACALMLNPEQPVDVDTNRSRHEAS